MLNQHKTHQSDCVGHLIWPVMALRCLHDWFWLFESSRQGSQARHRSATTVRLQYFDVMHAPFLQVTIWILYVQVLSHIINLPMVFLSLSIPKDYSSCKRSWCPSEISLLIKVGHSDMEKEKASLCKEVLCNLMHAIFLRSFVCLCSCNAC